MDFPFDLSFLDDHDPIKAIDTIDVKQLAAKIAETNDLVLRIKSLENEIKNSDQNVVELNNSVHSIKNLYDQERARVDKLSAANEKLREEVVSLRKELNQKQAEVERNVLLHEQSTAEYESKLENEKERYNSLCIQFTSQAKTLHEHDLLDSKAKKDVNEIRKKLLENNITIPQLKSPRKNARKRRVLVEKVTEKHEIGVNCNLIPKIENKIETVSRGTQYITSTTTRAACTSAFIKTRTIGTNFPERVTVSLEEALKETIFDIPAPISPIRDIDISAYRDCGTQTEIRSSTSIGSCTKIKNIRKRIRFYERNSHYPSKFITEDIKKESPMSSTTNLDYASTTMGDTKIGSGMPQLTNPLLDLWNLLGRTIFALIHSGNSSLNQSQIGMLSERMDACNRHLQLEITNRPFLGEHNYTKRECFGNLFTNELRKQMSDTSSADSLSMDDGETTNSSLERSNETHLTNPREANEVQFSSFNIFGNELPKNVVYSEISNGFSERKEDRICNKTFNISDNRYDNCKSVEPHQTNKTDCLENIYKGLSKEDDILSNISNTCRKSVITRTLHNSLPGEIGNLNDTNQCENSLEYLNQHKEEKIVHRRRDSYEMQSLPEEEFVLALSCEDIDRNFPQGLEEIDKIVESFSTQEPFEQFDDFVDIKKIPLKLNIGDSSEHEATPQCDDESQRNREEEKLNDSLDKKRDSSESTLSATIQKHDQSLNNIESEHQNRGNNEVVMLKKNEDDSTQDLESKEKYQFSAVDEILKMFSKLPASQTNNKIKRLKRSGNLSKRKLGSKNKNLLRKNGKIIKERDKISLKIEDSRHDNDRNSSEIQMHGDNEDLTDSEYNNSVCFSDEIDKMTELSILNKNVEKGSTSYDKLENLDSQNNSIQIDEVIHNNNFADSYEAIKANVENESCLSQRSISIVENQSTNEEFSVSEKIKENEIKVGREFKASARTEENEIIVGIDNNQDTIHIVHNVHTALDESTNGQYEQLDVTKCSVSEDKAQIALEGGNENTTNVQNEQLDKIEYCVTEDKDDKNNTFNPQNKMLEINIRREFGASETAENVINVGKDISDETIHTIHNAEYYIDGNKNSTNGKNKQLDVINCSVPEDRVQTSLNKIVDNITAQNEQLAVVKCSVTEDKDDKNNTLNPKNKVLEINVRREFGASENAENEINVGIDNHDTFHKAETCLYRNKDSTSSPNEQTNGIKCSVIEDEADKSNILNPKNKILEISRREFNAGRKIEENKINVRLDKNHGRVHTVHKAETSQDRNKDSTSGQNEQPDVIKCSVTEHKAEKSNTHSPENKIVTINVRRKFSAGSTTKENETNVGIDNNDGTIHTAHKTVSELNRNEDCTNRQNEQLVVIKCSVTEDKVIKNKSLNLKNKILGEREFSASRKAMKNEINVGIDENHGTVHTAETDLDGNKDSTNAQNGQSDVISCSVPDDKAPKNNTLNPKNKILSDFSSVILVDLNNESTKNINFQTNVNKSGKSKRRFKKDHLCPKRAKLENNTRVSNLVRGCNKNPEITYEDNNNEEIDLHRPSTPSNNLIDTILKECISNISPISRISDSNSEHDETNSISFNENITATQRLTSMCHENQYDSSFILESMIESDLSNESDFLGFPNEDIFDSPESPPPHECLDYELVPKLIPLERSIEYDTNYSPLSPCHETNFCNIQEPVIIPETRKCSKKTNANFQNLSKLNSVLGRIIQKFDEAQQLTIANDKTQNETAVESKLIIKVRQVLEHYVKSNASSSDVTKCIIRLVKRTKSSKIVSKSIIEVIEDTSDEIRNDLTPPLPAMTDTHKKIVLLVHTLNLHIKGFSDNLISMTEQRLFHLKPKRISLEILINLTILYIALIDLQETEKNPARFFIYKCLYYYNKEAVPMIYYILVSYPAVLPKKSDPYYDRSDAIISSIQCILNSLVYSMDKKDLKHREVFHILRLYYEYDRVKPSREEVIENLMAKIRAAKFMNVSYSFALICKHNGIEWTEKEVVLKHLLPALTEYYNLVLQSNAHDMNAAVLLESLSFVLKPFPLNYNVSRYLQIFTNFLHATNRKIVQEAAVRAVLRIQRFGCVNCFNIICNWNPNYKIDSNLRVMLKSFVHRKTLNFWKKVGNQI